MSIWKNRFLSFLDIGELCAKIKCFYEVFTHIVLNTNGNCNVGTRNCLVDQTVWNLVRQFAVRFLVPS